MVKIVFDWRQQFVSIDGFQLIHKLLDVVFLKDLSYVRYYLVFISHQLRISFYVVHGLSVLLYADVHSYISEANTKRRN